MDPVNALILTYAFFLAADFIAVFVLITAVRFRPASLFETHTAELKWSGDERELRSGVEEACDAVRRRLSSKTLTDGRRLIVVKSRMTAAHLTAIPESRRVELRCVPGPLHFIRFCMLMLLFSFFLGPLALVLLWSAIHQNRQLARDTFDMTGRILRRKERNRKGRGAGYGQKGGAGSGRALPGGPMGGRKGKNGKNKDMEKKAKVTKMEKKEKHRKRGHTKKATAAELSGDRACRGGLSMGAP